ncbi:MAG: Homoserine dehydrogenase [Pseudomonadales bacterium]|nr:Homoserine dehydrogenase [Pseudomonadales bacterium]
MEPIRVGICGFGTVGSGTFTVLQRNRADIAARVGRDVLVTHIGARRDNPRCDTAGARVSRDVFEVVRDPDVDIVVELIGGCDTARELVMEAIAAGKHVVTANKALIAEHGNAIFAAASARGVSVAFEAAVGGGIPIIKAIREGLAANRIEWVAGIINGTGNYILSEMREKGRSFAAALADAQALGYAEADPTFDVEGIDAAHKLVILASLAFGIPLQFDKVYTEGISTLGAEDIAYASELGYRIKHLGICRRTAEGIELRVHPTLIPDDRLIANVNGVMNAILVKGDAVGPTLYYGPGAGSEPTASSVVADIVDVARTLTADPEHRVPHLAFQPDCLSAEPVLPMSAVRTSYYLRVAALDRPGVLWRVARILGEAGISIEALIQKEAPEGQETATMILLTSATVESQMNAAIATIEALDSTRGRVTRIRMEKLEG